jgi:hypothetical protein
MLGLVWKCSSLPNITESDNSTKYFHNYANYQKVVNIIWEIKDSSGRVWYAHENIAKNKKDHFSNILKNIRVVLSPKY